MNNVVKNFKKGNRILLNKSSGIRKMLTAAGGPILISTLDIKNGANLLGSLFLRGLGTVGQGFAKVLSSPNWSGSSATNNHARGIKQAQRLKKESDSREQSIAKGSVWLSPLNYGTALVTGNGLNARKGNEEIEKLEPWLQALLRGSELYFGPKAVKGVKTAPGAVVNTAAKVGVKPAKTAVIAREINNATKKGVQSLEKLQPEIRTRYGDVEIDNPELAYRLVGKGAVENFLKTGELFVPVKLTGNKLRDALNNMMGGTPMYKQGSLWFGLDPINYPELFTTAEPLAIGNKHATIVKPWINPGGVIKKGIRTGEVDYAGKANLLGGRRVPFTEDLLNLSNVTSYKWVPGYGYKQVVKEPSTSLKFFERKPSKISEAEKAGVPKTERNLRLHGEPQAPYYDYSLINKHYEPWTVNEKGQFVFASPEKSKKLGTIHFSFNEPVVSHTMGSWDDAPTITILPYRNMRSRVAPVDMAIMDTYFPNYKGLKISSRGSKSLTGDKATFDYYKSRGLDVEFSPEIEAKLLELKVLNDRYEALKTNPGFDYFSEETQELLNQILATKTSIDRFGRKWTKGKIKPIPSYEKVNALGTAEGFDMETYPYSLASPKYDGYGVPLEESATELNYNWIHDPSNHFMIGEHPDVVLEYVLRGDYGKVRPELIEYLRWASEHGADFRKKGGILLFLQKYQQGGYIVQPNDNLWNISRNHGISLSELRNLNPQIKGDLIHPGDRLLITPQYKNKIVNLREERSRELSLDSIKAIQTYNHSGNYIIVDKKNSLLTVFDKNNNPIFKTNDISTGKSGDDYNTITYVDSKGKIRNNAGNNSTPAGITYITGKGKYHGFTSFTRGRINPDGSIEDIASSFHYGPTKDKKASNGCVRIGGKTLDKLSKYIDLGTPVYTLPEKEGSGFKLRNGKLNFVANNPYGTTKGSKKYWDDYNVRIDRSYSPLTIYYNGTNNDSTYNGNVLRFVNSISANKKALQKKFNLSSDEYNRLAELAVGIAELESKYGTSKRYKAKSYMPDWMISSIRGKNAARSRGMSQIKIKGDNKEMQNIYKQLKVNENSINNPETSAVATMARLAYMYNSEVKGRSFRGAKNLSVDPYDALLYKYMGRGLELSNKTATPVLNNYINNVKNYSKNFEFLEERKVRV